MIDLKDIETVKVLQIHLRSSLDTTPGREVMKFLDELCGWYDFSQTNTDNILIQHGRRQVLATIKSLLEHPAEDIVAVAQKEEM